MDETCSPEVIAKVRELMDELEREVGTEFVLLVNRGENCDIASWGSMQTQEELLQTATLALKKRLVRAALAEFMKDLDEEEETDEPC